jgi:hypothetical protein
VLPTCHCLQSDMHHGSPLNVLLTIFSCVQVATLTSTEVLAVHVKFKSLLDERMKRIRNPFDKNRGFLRFHDAVPPAFEGSFPTAFVVEKNLVEHDELFGAHSVVSKESANIMRQLLKRARDSESEEE